MPRLFMIGVHKENNKITAIRFLNFESVDKKEVVDIPCDKVVATLKAKGNGCIENLILEDGKLKGSNGDISRYGVIGKSSSIVIINRIVDDKGNTMGYDCCGAQGVVYRLRTNDVITLIHKEGIANGKLVDNGTEIISAINGTYHDEKLKTAGSSPSSSSTEEDTSEIAKSLTQDTLNRIKALSKDSRYSGSYVEKVVGTIKKTKKISDKQKQVIDSTYDKWCGAPASSSSASGDILEYTEIQNGQLQVKGLRREHIEYDGSLVIPRYHDNKVVVSIGREAFKGSRISAVKIYETVSDIGQYAFSQCRQLEVADLSLGVHRHIAIGTFLGCSRLRSVDTGAYVEKIHELAFSGTTRLEKIKLYKSVDTVARKAFSGSGIHEVIKSDTLKTINDSAFEGCMKLEEFDFSGVLSIGSHAFYKSGLKYAVIPSSVNRVGRYAFAYTNMEEVNIEEGVETIDECAFLCDHNAKTAIGKIWIPKSVKILGNNCLSNVKLVMIFHGTPAESFCIGFGVPFEYVDKLDETNSTVARLSQNMFARDSSVVKILYQQITKEYSEQPSVVLDESKMVTLPINETMAKTLRLELCRKEIEPSAMFKEAVNYITNTEELYKVPFEALVMRCIPIVYVEREYIYNDECNMIVKYSYIKKSTLEQAEFIVVIMNNQLRYVCDSTNITDIEIYKKEVLKYKIPLQIMRMGDTIGYESTISGEDTKIDTPEGRVNVGEMVLNKIMESMPKVNVNAHIAFYIDTRSQHVIKLADNRTYDKDGRVKRGTPNSINVLDVITKEELYKIMRSNRKVDNKNNKFFDELMHMDNSEIDMQKVRLDVVFPESIINIYVLAKELAQKVGHIDSKLITTEMLDERLFDEVAGTYWMIEKDTQWFGSVGKKSLNLVARHKIGNSTVEEYVSNQIVKFSNPYMQGGKGAHIFVKKKGQNVTGIYASKLSLERIVQSLYNIADYDESKVPANELMSNPSVIDEVDTSLFFRFYNVLEKNSGWQFTNPYYGKENRGCDFALSIYKPTGVMYLVVYALTYQLDDDKKKQVTVKQMCHPIFKIGDIDRALEVADTTNNMSRAKRLSNELVAFAQMIGINRQQTLDATNIWGRYIKIRQLTMAGEPRMSEYADLASDRLLLMIGTKAKGAPSVYNPFNDTIRITYEDDDYEEETVGEIEEYTEEDVEDISDDIIDSDIEMDDMEDEFEMEDMELSDEDELEEDDETSSMIDMIASLSDEELKELGLTAAQREDMIAKVLAGELRA